jgi:acetyl-CoA C-acetyltransferase
VSVDPRTPVLVGAGQITNRRERLVEPLGLMAEAARAADADSGGASLQRVQAVHVVHMVSWSYPAPATALGEELGLPSGERTYTAVGGNSSQWLLSLVCDRIARGEIDGALIAGAETLDSVRRQRASGVKVERGDRDAPVAEPVIGDDRVPVIPPELAARIITPTTMYAMFENALAAREGHDADEHRRAIGELMAPFSTVAASHPDTAWFPVEHAPEAIATISDDNRLIGEPYTKLMNAVLQVDMAGALIVLSAEAAEAAGVPLDRWVFPWAGTDGTEIFSVAERPDVLGVPALELAADALFDTAGVGVDDVTTIDIYSCFPSAVQLAAGALGVRVDDERGLTMTGGLPYFGGPGSNYVSHSIAYTAERLRERPGIGLVTGVGWYMTKHSLGLYGSEPPPKGWTHPDLKTQLQALEADAVEVATDADSDATVEAFTIDHHKDAGPLSAPLYARLSDGRRVVANVADPDLPKALSGRNLVGETVRVRGATYEVV